jgi:hypothetical protein
VVESHLGRHATAENGLMGGAEVRHQTDLEGGVLEVGAGDECQVVRLSGRVTAEEGGDAEGRCVRLAAADHSKAEHVPIERGERGRVARAEADVADTDSREE